MIFIILICISLMTCDGEYFFMCLFAKCISSSMTCLLFHCAAHMNCFCCYFVFAFEAVSLCSLAYPSTLDPPVSASQVLEVQTGGSMPGRSMIFLDHTN
jgi:hypothetical protein